MSGLDRHGHEPVRARNPLNRAGAVERRVSSRSLRFLRSLLFVFLCCLPAFAHELRPAYLELREQSPGEFALLWKTPMRGELRLALSPEFSARTEQLMPPATRRTGDAAVQTWRLKAIEPLRGRQVRIAGLTGTMTDTLVRMEFLDGTTWTQRLTPQQPSTIIPPRPNPLAVAGLYGKLGIEHILLGIDHLLFVLALLIITLRAPPLTPALSPSDGERVSGGRVRGISRLIKTVTAFTMAHSITLGLATLGFVRVPAAPVEAVIALSIVFVASEIPRRPLAPSDEREADGLGGAPASGTASVHPPTPRGGEGGAQSLTARAPWIVAFVFGLLHGFGFAGALTELGLPQGQIPVALLFFNLGVEAGQLLFIAGALIVIALWNRATAKLRSSPLDAPSAIVARLVPPYAIGGVAMFWVIQRIAAF